MSDTRRAHAPIEYAVMSTSGAGQDAPWAKVRFGSKSGCARAAWTGLVMNPTRPSAANLAVIENGHS